VSSSSAALLEGKQLLRTECFVMDLRGRLDEVLEMSASEEVTKVHEFAVVLVFHIDDTPAVLTTSDLTTPHDNGFLGPDNSERNDILPRC
jgi:hypothetical protein